MEASRYVNAVRKNQWRERNLKYDFPRERHITELVQCPLNHPSGTVILAGLVVPFFERCRQDYCNFIVFFKIISTIAGILLKSQDFNFCLSKIFVVILRISDILFGSEYKREI